MKLRILFITLGLITFIGCKEKKACQDIIKVNADSLIVDIDKYEDSLVETEGIITHVCRVEGKKMKLKTQGGKIIKIVSQDTLEHFDKSLYKKKVRVQGIVREQRLGKSYLDKIEKERILLCHIDNTPCKDSAWVNRQIKAGTADTLSKKGVAKLRKKMEKDEKNYVSVIIIIAEKIEAINEN